MGTENWHVTILLLHSADFSRPCCAPLSLMLYPLKLHPLCVSEHLKLSSNLQMFPRGPHFFLPFHFSMQESIRRQTDIKMACLPPERSSDCRASFILGLCADCCHRGVLPRHSPLNHSRIMAPCTAAGMCSDS